MPFTVTAGKLKVCCVQIPFEIWPLIEFAVTFTTTVPLLPYQVMPEGWLGAFNTLNKQVLDEKEDAMA